MPSLRNFPGSRGAVARALIDGPKTASEIGQALDRSTGSIFGVLTRMLTDGLVLPDTDVPGRGTRYSLAPAAFETPGEVQRGPPKPNLVQAGQQLLLVEQPPDRTRVQRVLGESRFMAQVAWAAETAGGWLLAIEADDTQPAEGLVIALEAAGVKSRLLPVNGVSSGLELRTRAVKLLDEREKAIRVIEGEQDEH